MAASRGKLPSLAWIVATDISPKFGIEPDQHGSLKNKKEAIVSVQKPVSQAGELNNNQTMP
jgi:hypothetical protein